MNETLREMAGAPVGTITLGGRTYRLRELNWNDYCEIEAAFGKDPDEWRGMRAARFILWLGLRKEDPSLTLERVGELVSVSEFEAAAEAIDRLMGHDPNEEATDDPKNG